MPVVILTVVMLMSAVLVPISSISSAASIQSGQININGDHQLITEASANGWAGNGTSSTSDGSPCQAYDDNENEWNTTTMGNYWGDWQSPAVNGIVNVPYLIDGDSGAQDSYPLVMTPAVSMISSYNDTGSATISWSGSGICYNIGYYDVRVDGGQWTNVSLLTSYTFSGLTNDEHTVYVKATDKADNVSTTSVMFTVDTVKPTVTAYSQTGSGVALNSTMTVMFSKQMNESSVSVVVNGVTGTLSWNGNTATFMPSSSLAYNTTYSVSVSGRDLAGNELTTTEWKFTSMKDEGIISGTVKDANGNVIANATVTLSNGMTTTTDANGHFVLDNVTAGTYNVTVTKNGYTALTQSVSTTAGTTSGLGTLVVQSAPSSPSSNNGPMIVVMIIVIVALLAVALVMYRKRKKQDK